MRSRKSQRLTSETFLLITVETRVLDEVCVHVLNILNKLLCCQKIKNKTNPRDQSSTHRFTQTPTETLSSYKYLHCPEMGAPRVIKMMEGCRKLSLHIFM